MLKKVFLFAMLLLCVSAFCETTEEQIKGLERSWDADGTRLGMPGLANMRVVDNNKPPFYTGVLPKGDDKFVIPLGHEISYGGLKYRHLTVASGGRIFLGNYANYILPKDGIDGLYPYVKPVANDFIPVPESVDIPMIWRQFKEHGDVFTVVEFGPFLISGHEERFLCQVSFYDDGEIQVQHWNLNRSNASVRMEHESGFVEREYMVSPFVYNGGKRISRQGRLDQSVYTHSAIKVFDNGILREGWIAKAFDGAWPAFEIKDGFLDVDFGTDRFAGGLLAYDYARENPIVGSFQGIQFSARAISGGSEDEPIYVWYFSENQMYPNLTLEAGYPFVNESAQIEIPDVSVNDGVDPRCITANYIISPCAYGHSWKAFNGVADTIIAPAIKMQVVHSDITTPYFGRKLRIRYIRFLPLQPRSIQFKPPAVDTVEYEGEVGFLEIAGTKAPVSMPSGTVVDARIHSSPGFIISKIYVNGKTAFDENDDKASLQGIVVENQKDLDEAFLRFPLVSNVKISVSFRACSAPVLSEVVPSYEKNEIFLDPKDNTKKLTTYSVKDGFSRIVQTQMPVNENLFRVTATYFDDAGNVQYAPKSFVVGKSDYSFEKMHCKMCVNKSVAYYNGDTTVLKDRVDAFGYPYAMHDFHYGENRAIVGTTAGMGRANFAEGNHFAKSWRIPVKGTSTSEFYSIKQIEDRASALPNGIGSVFDNDYHGRLEFITDEDLKTDVAPDYPYVLMVNQSFDGVYTQSISDVAGNLMATWMTYDDEVLVTRYVYNDYTSQLCSTFVEGHHGFATKYEYDERGRQIATVSSDRGRRETRYDSQNRVRYTRNARQIAKGGSEKNYFNVLVYDDWDRIVRVGEVRGDCNGCSFDNPDALPPENRIHLLSRTIYGKPSKDDLRSASYSMLDESLAEYLANSIEGVAFNDVGATISYDGNENVNTMKMASFDRIGRKKKQWVVNLVEEGAPAIEVDYEYTTSDKAKRTSVLAWDYARHEWKPVAKREMVYGRLDRLESIYELDLADDNVKSKLVDYDYDAAGTRKSVTYYDKGQKVFTKKVSDDIYGRVTRVDYRDFDDRELYAEELEYSAPPLNRISKLTHTWNGDLPQRKVVKESFGYDGLGRLSTFETDMGEMTNAQYSYDIFGRLTTKSEADTLISYDYVDGLYRPVDISINGVTLPRATEYDASGNIWLDAHENVAYKLNASGLPERVIRYGTIPEMLTLDDVDGNVSYNENEIGDIRYAYDENGSRVWERYYENGGDVRSSVFVPGIGTFVKTHGPNFAVDRLDLVAGGFRIGQDGKALFPIKDAQGNIRGYAGSTDMQSMYAYYPFGTTHDISNDPDADMRRWQSKEFDGEHGKYFFGARYFDPFFGLWISPDPAGQYANPYTYGGDPLNYVDPTGLFAIGAGIVFSWDPEHGWGIGFGLAANPTYKGKDYSGGGSLELSWMAWQQDGSHTFTFGASGNWQYWIFNFNAGLGFSYDTYSGGSLTTQGGVCVGNANIACAGVEAGGGVSWDKYGNFAGATVYGEVVANFAGGFANVSTGYEAGLFGAEGRGLYAGSTIAGAHAEITHLEDGFDLDNLRYSGQGKVYIALGNNSKKAALDGHTESMVTSEIWIPTLGRWGHFDLGLSRYDVSNPGVDKVEYDELLRLVDDPVLYDEIVRMGCVSNFTEKLADDIDAYLLEKKGFERNDHIGQHEKGSDKRTYRPRGSHGYGNIEIIVRPNGTTYSSYNYGNNIFTHFMIDVLGYWGRWAQ